MGNMAMPRQRPSRSKRIRMTVLKPTEAIRRLPPHIKLWKMGVAVLASGALAAATHPMALLVALPLAILIGLPWHPKGWR